MTIPPIVGRWTILSAFFLASIVFIPSKKIYAASFVWIDANGDWSNPSNWDANAVPNDSSAKVDISNGSTPSLTTSVEVAWIAVLQGSGLNVSNGAVITVYDPQISISSANDGSSITFDGAGISIQADMEILSGFSGVTLGPGGLTINNNGFTNNITSPLIGPGGLTSTGGGSLILSSANTYSGETAVGPNSNLVQGAANALSPNSSVTNNGTVDVNGFPTTIGALSGGGIVTNNGSSPVNIILGNNNGNGDFAGNIQDGISSVALTKVGTGTQVLSGNNTYSGNTTVQAGTLEVDGKLASPNVMVNSGGTLAGTGVLAGTVTNLGIVSPGQNGGNGIGTLTVGNYNQSSTGTLLMQIASAESYDQLVVQGTANLDGTLQIESGDACGEFTLLTAEHINGTFSQVLGLESAHYELLYNPNSVELIIPCITMEDLMIPLNYKGLFFNIANTQYGQMANRLAAIRAGVSGISLLGMNEDPMMDKYNQRQSGQKMVAVPDAARWDIFVAASGIYSNIKNVNDLPRLNAITGYFSAGADCRVSDNLYVGFYGGYQGSKAWYYNRSYTLASNGVKYGVYGTAEWGGYFSTNGTQWNGYNVTDDFYINALLGGGSNFLNIKRPGNVKNPRSSVANSVARGNPFQQELDSLLGCGYEVKVNSWIFGLNNSIQYTYLGFSSFTESGAGYLNLKVGKQNPSSLVYTLGANVSYLWEINNWVILPTVGLSWQHEFLNYSQGMRTQFANGRGSAMTFNTWEAPRNYAFGSAGITAQFGPRWGAYAYYNPQFGFNNNQNQIFSHGVIVGVNYTF